MPETVRWSPSPGFSGSTSGPEGTAARLGGDELVAVLAEVGDSDTGQAGPRVMHSSLCSGHFSSAMDSRSHWVESGLRRSVKVRSAEVEDPRRIICPLATFLQVSAGFQSEARWLRPGLPPEATTSLPEAEQLTTFRSTSRCLYPSSLVDNRRVPDGHLCPSNPRRRHLSACGGLCQGSVVSFSEETVAVPSEAYTDKPMLSGSGKISCVMVTCPSCAKISTEQWSMKMRSS